MLNELYLGLPNSNVYVATSLQSLLPNSSVAFLKYAGGAHSRICSYTFKFWYKAHTACTLFIRHYLQDQTPSKSSCLCLALSYTMASMIRENLHRHLQELALNVQACTCCLRPLELEKPHLLIWQMKRPITRPRCQSDRSNPVHFLMLHQRHQSLLSIVLLTLRCLYRLRRTEALLSWTVGCLCSWRVLAVC